MVQGRFTIHRILINLIGGFSLPDRCNFIISVQTSFDAPEGTDPVALDLGSMGKGQAWVNGRAIGRYWLLVSPKGGCTNYCDYRGAYHEGKCSTNCGLPTQSWYLFFSMKVL